MSSGNGEAAGRGLYRPEARLASQSGTVEFGLDPHDERDGNVHSRQLSDVLLIVQYFHEEYRVAAVMFEPHQRIDKPRDPLSR